MPRTITASIERDTETGYYLATVPAIPGAHTQAETLDELQRNIIEVVEMCIEENRKPGTSPASIAT
jgi:predicted RNase H-like HicB family nuclease